MTAGRKNGIRGGAPPRESRPPAGDAVIRARGIRRSFGPERALDGVDLEVLPGEIFGLVGPDGAGKTTAMRVLCGVLRADGGEAKVAGFDVTRRPREVKKRIGYMSQRFSLYEDLTVGENLFFFSSLHRVTPARRRQRGDELLEAFRLDRFRRRLAGALSGGMKQKLALACTLMHRPQILFLDEPTTGVDPVSRREFWKILYRLAGEGVSILVSTPYMDEAERCHRLSLMDRGKVLLRGTPDEVRASMGGEILEVEASPQRTARDLIAVRPDVRDCTAFGSRIHIVVENAEEAEPAIVADLRAAGVSVLSSRAVQPGLEDVFIATVKRGGRDR